MRNVNCQKRTRIPKSNPHSSLGAYVLGSVTYKIFLQVGPAYEETLFFVAATFSFKLLPRKPQLYVPRTTSVEVQMEMENSLPSFASLPQVYEDGFPPP